MIDSKTLPRIKQNSYLSDSSIKSNMKFLSGFGNSDYQSSSTLQNSILSVSFPKARRFSHHIPEKGTIYDLPSTLTKRYCGFGFGEKICFPPQITNNAKQNPGPGTYDNFVNQLKITMRNKLASISNFRVYDRMAPIRKSSSPGPGSYSTDLKGKGRMISFKGKKQSKNVYNLNNPNPTTYDPNYDFVLQKTIRKIKLESFSSRPSIVQNQKDIPGPGTYNIP